VVYIAFTPSPYFLWDLQYPLFPIRDGVLAKMENNKVIANEILKKLSKFHLFVYKLMKKRC